jgi:hypothetical protein
MGLVLLAAGAPSLCASIAFLWIARGRGERVTASVATGVSLAAAASGIALLL